MKGKTVTKELPSIKQAVKEQPDAAQAEKAAPDTGVIDNTIEIGGKKIEIKPTKLKYYRNHTAAFYQMVDVYPLSVILAMDETVFGDGRDGDKCLLDWLVAVFDDSDFVVQNYNDMDTVFIERALEIFKRVNKIDEKEEKLKKLQPPQKEE